MKLTNPTDDELNAAVAEYVAGWKDPITLFAWHDRKARQRPLRYYKERPKVNGFTPLGDYSAFVTESGDKVYCGTPFAVHRLDTSFTTSADAVLPWLEKWTSETNFPVYPDKHGQPNRTLRWWSVQISDESGRDISGFADTFPRAACIALLRAHGVEVEFTKGGAV